MTSSNNDRRDYSDKAKVELGLMAVFPTPEAFRSFVEDDKGDVGPFVGLARTYGIIAENEGDEAFEAFIEDNSREPEECTPPGDLTLSELLEDKNKIKLSVRSLTGWINDLMNEFDLKDLMPAGKVSNAMFTRLGRGPANTLAKRNTLRLLSFWFGYKRPQLGRIWNYETLLKLCPSEQKPESDEGARIAFYLHSRGDLIEDKTVKWLRNELRDCIRDLGHVQYGNIQSYSTTSFYLDLPNETTAKEGLSHLSAYSRCVRDAIAIAHQLSIRWALSPLSSQRRIMTIGIASGEFSALDVYLQAIINAKLPGDPVIRMTGYARQCVLVNDIRAIFCSEPKEIEVFDGEVVNIWWVTELWNIYYWDFVPALLKDEVLQTDPKSQERLNKLLWFPDKQLTLEDKGRRLDAVTTFLKSPQNSLLGLEIVKALFYRRRFLEANELLRIILSTEPLNMTARTLRIAIFSNLGLDDSLPYSVSEVYFETAEVEAWFIEENCINKDEDFFCEYGLSKLANALRILRILRDNGGEFQEKELKLKKEDMYNLLDESETILMKGVTVSSTGHRSAYIKLCVRSLQRMMKKDEDFIKRSDSQLSDKYNLCRETGEEMFFLLNWLRNDLKNDMRHSFIKGRLENAAALYTDSVGLRSRQPNVLFSFACLLFDFSPIMTVDTVRNVLRLLNKACDMAKRLEKDDVCVVSLTRVNAEILPINVFITHNQEAINQIENRVGKLEDLEGRTDSDLIDGDLLGGLRLFCLNI